MPDDTTATIGRDELGPVMEWYLHRLDHHLQIAAERDALVLFVARAGVRLHELYHGYLAARDRIASADNTVLWASRFLFCKAFANQAPAVVNEHIRKTFRAGTIADLVTGLTRHEPDVEAKVDWEDPGLSRPVAEFDVANLGGLLNHHNAALLSAYFETYESLLGRYLEQLGWRPGRPIVFVDSGWQGSMHELASAGLPGRSIESLYVGALAVDDGHIPAGVTGLLLDARRPSSGRPEEAMADYRHLIESVLEARTESAESLVERNGRIVCPQAGWDDPDPEIGLDGLYLAVRDSLVTADRSGPAEMSRRFETASAALAKRLWFPTPNDVELLSAGSRSADFGRAIEMPVPLPTEDRHDHDSPDRRILDSLWPQAQAIVEYGPERGAAVQGKLNAYSDSADYFTHRSTTVTATADEQDRPLVLICTRTKDRPILLERAARSVADQTYDNYLWVIVNDGGDPSQVVDVLDRCPVDPSRILLVSHATSQGMEAASNAGIGQAPSDLVVIHDDDDSWQPAFLETAVGFLASERGREYGAVVLGSMKVDEILTSDGVKIVNTSEYNPFLSQIDLIEMLAGNLFPPISFVFRRSIHDEIGGFDETLPVLGDWDFNIRFLQLADIAVVQEPLANYHHREPGTTLNYSNSVTGGSDLHAEFRTRLIHRYLRGGAGPNVAAYLMQSQVMSRMRQVTSNQQAARGEEPSLTGGSLMWSWVALQWLLEGNGDPNEEIAKSIGAGPARRQADLIERAMKDDDFMRRVAPADGFDEHDYLNANPDVKAAVGVGQFGSGFEHYLRHGLSEGRRLRP